MRQRLWIQITLGTSKLSPSLLNHFSKLVRPQYSAVKWGKNYLIGSTLQLNEKMTMKHSKWWHDAGPQELLEFTSLGSFWITHLTHPYNILTTPNQQRKPFTVKSWWPPQLFVCTENTNLCQSCTPKSKILENTTRVHEILDQFRKHTSIK